MAKNKDGLEAGQPVDFATIKRVETERRLKEAENAKPTTPRTTTERTGDRDTESNKKPVRRFAPPKKAEKA